MEYVPVNRFDMDCLMNQNIEKRTQKHIHHIPE